jgi:uncharacterized protein
MKKGIHSADTFDPGIRRIGYTVNIVRSTIRQHTARVAARVIARAACAVLVAGFALWARPLVSQQPGALTLPAPTGYVNDFANVLSADTKARLEALALRVNAATRGDMVIVTLSDLGGRPKEDVALELGRQWKIGSGAKVGDAARNAGVVILVVPKETSSDGGHCRIETGQGAEGFITDATSGTLCREAVPQFAAGNYAGGIEYLASAVADRYAESFGVTLDGQPRRARRSAPSSNGPSPALVLVFVVVVLIILSNRRTRGCVGCLPIPIPFPTGGGRGGFGGFSGGGFGGGGGGGGFGGFGGGGGFSGGGGGADW